MKKSIEIELKALAEKILERNEEANNHQLKAFALEIYEKLTLLDFVEAHLTTKTPEKVLVQEKDEHTVEQKSEKATEGRRKKENDDRYAPDGMKHNTEAITEPNTEKIKDIVAQMPLEAEAVDEVFADHLVSEEKDATDWSAIGVSYDELPTFERKKKGVETASASEDSDKVEEENHDKTNAEEGLFSSPSEEEGQHAIEPVFSRQQSLNDRLKKGISFGLNDRLIFIKQLFAGDKSDYDRVISQLNTFDNWSEAEIFLQETVKPDYQNWEGKKEIEKRFLVGLQRKF